MRTFSRTSQFKKDVKLAERRGKDLAKLKVALDLLIAGGLLPPEYKDHHFEETSGQPRLSRRTDWILIYTLTEKGSHVRLERTGTHSDLFR